MNVDKEKTLIEYLISSPDAFALCYKVLDYEFFDATLQKSVKFIMDYYDEYDAIPSPKTIKSETGQKFALTDIANHEVSYAVSEVEKFCKRMALQEAILDSAKLIEKGPEFHGEIEDMIKTAIMLSVNNDLGISYFDTVAERLERMRLQPGKLPTRWPKLNALLGGGPARKNLMLFSANSGVGKSIVMANMSVDYAEMGYNVLYITLELDEDTVGQRIDTMITGITSDEWLEHIPEIINGVKKFSKDGAGRLDIAYLPTESKANDIRAYLKNYNMHYDVMPDIICIDYLDKMQPNQKMTGGNAFDIDKKLSEQVRQIAVDFNALVVTASQLNRSAVDEPDQNHSHIAGGISKINEADIYISMFMNESMRGDGDMIFNFQKTRNSGGVGKNLLMGWDAVKLRINETGKGDDAITRMAGKAKKAKKKDNPMFDSIPEETGFDLTPFVFED